MIVTHESSQNELIEAKKASNVAIVGNGLLGGLQLLTTALSGNVGFVGESIHNLSDSASFYAKKLGYTAGCEKIRNISTKIGALLFMSSGVVALGLGAKNIISDEYEEYSALPLSVAIGSVAINASIATYVKNKENAKGLLRQTHEHADTDLYTGVLYASGLIAEKWVPGIANWAIVAGGAFTTLVGSKHLREGGHHH